MKIHFCSVMIFLLFFLLISCNNVTNQKEEKRGSDVKSDSLKNITKLERFLSKRGELIIKDYYEVGKVISFSHGDFELGIDVKALVIYKPGEEERRIKGLTIEIIGQVVVYLDMDELKSLSDAIKYMEDLLIKWKTIPKEYTEVIYSTTSNFELGFYKKSENDKPDKILVFAKGGYNRARCNFETEPVEDLNLIRVKIDEGIKLLNSK